MMDRLKSGRTFDVEASLAAPIHCAFQSSIESRPIIHVAESLHPDGRSFASQMRTFQESFCADFSTGPSYAAWNEVQDLTFCEFQSVCSPSRTTTWYAVCR